MDIAQLGLQPVAMQRRILRYAAGQIDSAPDFAATEALRRLAEQGRAGQKLELAGGLRAERTHRDLRLARGPIQKEEGGDAARYECVIPGVLRAPEIGCLIRIAANSAVEGVDEGKAGAVLRAWKPGDRVKLRYSSAPKKVKEVLERMKVSGQERTRWPVVEVAGRIVWMRGVELEPDATVKVTTEPL